MILLVILHLKISGKKLVLILGAGGRRFESDHPDYFFCDFIRSSHIRIFVPSNFSSIFVN